MKFLLLCVSLANWHSLTVELVSYCEHVLYTDIYGIYRISCLNCELEDTNCAAGLGRLVIFSESLESLAYRQDSDDEAAKLKFTFWNVRSVSGRKKSHSCSIHMASCLNFMDIYTYITCAPLLYREPWGVLRQTDMDRRIDTVWLYRYRPRCLYHRIYSPSTQHKTLGDQMTLHFLSQQLSAACAG